MMHSYLLYPDKAWMNEGAYDDMKSIIQDLGLDTIFRIASQMYEEENGDVKKVLPPDPFIMETMRKVMMVPIADRDTVYFRQEIMKDVLKVPEVATGLYEISTWVLKEWDKLGRHVKDKMSNKTDASRVMTQIRLVSLFVEGLAKIKTLLREHKDELKSVGLTALAGRIEDRFSDEREEKLRNLLKEIVFYVSNEQIQEERNMIQVPKIVMNCSVGNGLKMDDVKLVSVESKSQKYRDPNSPIAKVQEYMNSKVPDSFSLVKSAGLSEDGQSLILAVVQFQISSCDPFVNEFAVFFDQLHLESAFYTGAVLLQGHFKRFELEYCFPTVGKQEDLKFWDLKEAVMCIEQRVKAVGNTCEIQDKMLLVVTGANQGGKSTFLRSIGIAQIMMQAGFFVAARSYESGLFTSFFTHFTRREDSSMNSGRLDEELGRMSQIVDRLGPATMILLNESFATTTEKEGSVIAYDIIKALLEQGVKVLTVTHLLSFAQKVYEESLEKEERGEKVMSAFLSAERKEDGRRTYRMIEHAPSLTSFGLDLYKQIVGEIPGFC